MLMQSLAICKVGNEVGFSRKYLGIVMRFIWLRRRSSGGTVRWRDVVFMTVTLLRHKAWEVITFHVACVLLARPREFPGMKHHIITWLCIGCMWCFKIGLPLFCKKVLFTHCIINLPTTISFEVAYTLKKSRAAI